MSTHLSGNVQSGVEGRPTGPARLEPSFPVDFANEIAHLESFNKHLYRPNTYLHKWWARRCGSTFRLILKHLVDDLALRDYYRPGGLEGKVILDPMMGGGTTLHEAIRLGANVIGADVDPVPILQARATLSQIDLAELESAFAEFYGSLRARLSQFFVTACPRCGAGTDMMYMLYGQRQQCACGPVLRVDSTTLRHEPDGSRIVLCGKCGDVYRTGRGTDNHICAAELLPVAVREKQIGKCPVCGDPYGELTSVPFYARFTPIAVVGQCQDHGLFFKAPSQADVALINRADEARDYSPFKPLDDFSVESGPKSIDLINHGVTTYLDLFSSRQLMYLAAAIESLGGVQRLIRLNLGLLLSTSTEFNSMLCGYKGGARRRPGAIRHVFSLHAYSFPYTALENNPLYGLKSSGTLQGLFHTRLRKGRQWAALPTERKIRDGKVQEQVAIRGEVDIGQEVSSWDQLQTGSRRFLLMQGTSVTLRLPSAGVDHVVTDPPYFDNVQYSDLSAFFRVWLKRLFPGDAQWDYDLSQSAVDPQANGNDRYETALTGIYRECRRVLRPGGRLIFTFHHWNPRGWAALTNALKSAGFVLLDRYVIHAENPASVHILDLRALSHDAVLVLGAASTEAGPAWGLPDRVDSTNSETFTRDCADALGWMLAADVDRDAIVKLWNRLLT